MIGSRVEYVIESGTTCVVAPTPAIAAHGGLHLDQTISASNHDADGVEYALAVMSACEMDDDA